MCGILGYYNTGLSFEKIKLLNDLQSHRGPDFSKVKKFIFKNKNLFFAHNRLSIQDLINKEANQPMENDRYAIVFNGEIYNHLEIRNKLSFKSFKTNSDTETILHSFSEFGIVKSIESFSGMFSIALFDKLNHKLYLIRDRVGIKPLYWTFNNGEFCFSSQLKGISNHLKTKINNKSLIQFMSTGYAMNDSSYYKNINKLKPAHFLVFDGENTKTFRYWDLPDSSIDINFNEAVNETERLIKTSINQRLLSDLEVGCFLSGGIDSSLVCAIMQNETSRRIKTFSIGFEDKKYDESIYAKDIAKYLGTDHYEYIFTQKDLYSLLNNLDDYYDEPFGDSSSLPMMILSQITKNNVTVALSGDGGDELFLGYERYFFTNNFYKYLNKTPQFLRNIMGLVCDASALDKLEKMSYPIKNLSVENLYSVLYTSFRPWNINNLFEQDFIHQSYGKNQISLLDIFDYKFKGNDLMDKLSRLDFSRYLPDDILTKVDRASMAYGLEARVPLLDHNIVEFAYKIPTQIKLKNGPKSILREILFNKIPKHLIDRPKKGFSVPLKHWFR
jgi:asparagine synthase (glutamine-hydrolysing)